MTSELLTYITMKGFKPFQVCLDIQHTDIPKIMDYKLPVTINQDVHLEQHICFITTLVTMTCGFVLVYIIYSVLVCLTILYVIVVSVN